MIRVFLPAHAGARTTSGRVSEQRRARRGGVRVCVWGGEGACLYRSTCTRGPIHEHVGEVSGAHEALELRGERLVVVERVEALRPVLVHPQHHRGSGEAAGRGQHEGANTRTITQREFFPGNATRTSPACEEG